MSWLNWIAWLFGVSSTVAIIVAIALAFLAPSVLVGIMEFVKPWLKLLGEKSAGFVRWCIDVLKVAIPDILSPWQTFLAFLVIVALSFGSGYMYKSVANSCPDVALSIRADYKLVKRTAAEKKVYLKSVGKSDWDVFWATWF